MKNFNSMADDYSTSQSNLVAGDGQQLHQNQQQQQQQSQQAHLRGRQPVVDEMSQDLNYLSREAPLDGGESTFGAATSYSQLAGSQREESVLHMGSELGHHQDDDERNQFYTTTSANRADSPSDQQLAAEAAALASGQRRTAEQVEQLAPDNVDIQRPLQQSGSIEQQQPEHNKQSPFLQLKPFLVSFMVDARGGAMRGCRHSGVRVIIPPSSAQMPMRITCRYLRRERLVHPPPLMEGEACASKIMEVGPAGAKFLGPVLIEVPHFASLRGQEREIIILRSDSGEIWREHLVEADDKLVESIIQSAQLNDDDGGEQQQENFAPGSAEPSQKSRRLTRIVTNEFPQYFAIISRVRQEVHPVGPQGSTVSSQVVPKVQAIFPQGALKKRIKIGLQGKDKKDTQQQEAQQQQQQQLDSINSTSSQHKSESGQPEVDGSLKTNEGGDGARLRSSSPTDSQQAAEGPDHRATSPSGQRPGSSSAKRRSRFLACFGGQGSIDLLDSATDGSSAGGGGDSPRQPCKEKPVERRHIVGDVEDSDGETHGSPSPVLERSNRCKRQTELELVPDDYYIERELPLILNGEPKTYGKRLASSSAQTDAKIQDANAPLSTSAKKPAKRRAGGLLRRKHKTQMNIVVCERPKSALGGDQLADSSLETVGDSLEVPRDDDEKHLKGLGDDLSIIQDVITSDDQKWRTCTIQTDSDSVTVNYVTIADDSTNGNSAAATATGGGGGLDDGYVSGSGDINRQSSFGKGLFGLSRTPDLKNQTTDGADLAKDAKKAKKQRAKSAKKSAKKEKTTKAKQVSSTSEDDPISKLELLRPDSPESIEQRETTEPTSIATATEEQQAADSGPRSLSPSAKELKVKLKLERQEKSRREKEERKQLKELEEAAIRAEKLKRKEEKEEAKRAEKLAKKSAKKSSSSSPATSLPQTPQPPEQPASMGDESSSSAVATSSSASNSQPGNRTNSVKFASALVETNSIHSSSSSSSLQADGGRDKSNKQRGQDQQQLDSIQQVIETTKTAYEDDKKRLSQEDGHDLLNMSIADSGAEASLSLGAAGDEQSQPPNQVQTSSKLISFSDDSEGPQKSLESEAAATGPHMNLDESTVSRGSVSTSEPLSSLTQTTTNLKPILKQQSTVSSSGEQEEVGAEIVIGEPEKRNLDPQLVGEASDEAVRAADALKAAASGPAEPDKKALAKLAKEQKAQLKREAKAQLEEAKRLAKEAKLAAKEAAKVKAAEEAEQARLAKEEAKKLKLERLKLAKGSKKKTKKDEEQPSTVEDTVAIPPVSSTSNDDDDTTTTTTTATPSAPTAGDIVAGEAETKKVDEAPETDDAENKSQLIVGGEERISTENETTTSPSGEQETSESVAVVAGDCEKGKKQKKTKKAKKSKKASSKEAESKSESTEPLESSSSASKSSSGFLARLFGKRSQSKSSDAPAEPSEGPAATGAQGGEHSKITEHKPEILSEMYPSDPDDADGEMILEVNVPKSLIDDQMAKKAAGGDWSQASDAGQATTIDESLGTSTTAAVAPIEQAPIDRSDVGQQLERQQRCSISSGGRQATLDDQATLVNVSQMITSEVEGDDDDATENVVSQANDLTQDLELTETVTWDGGEPVVSAAAIGQQIKTAAGDGEGEQPGDATQVAAAGGSEATPAMKNQEVEGEDEDEDKQKGKPFIGDGKSKKELEAKLDKEAKKRLKEEEKLRKKEAKEEELRVKLERKLAAAEAKKQAKEEKERLKREAKELKKQAALAKKQQAKSKPEDVPADSVIVLNEGEIFESDKAAAAAAAASSGGAASADPQATSGLEHGDEDGMQPVQTETEVQRIVEEVMGEDGVMTRTTKTIETKLVTMRHEEIKGSERRDMPAEEYERIKRSEQVEVGATGGRVSLERPTGSMMVVPPYEHPELEAIRSTPSYFSDDFDPNAATVSGEDESGAAAAAVAEPLSPKRAMKKRIKLNQRLVKCAFKLAKGEAKKAKADCKAAKAEIAVCDEAAREAQKQLKKALKEAKRATKAAAKDHKKMDKMDKKLAKRQVKIEKRQRKLDKRSAKLAKKREKTIGKEAKALAKSSSKVSASSGSSSAKLKRGSSTSSGSVSKKSIRLEDIGEPVLKSSSRLSIGGLQTGSGNQMMASDGGMVIGGGGAIERQHSPASDDIQEVEMSLDDSSQQQQVADINELAEKVRQQMSELADTVVVTTTTTPAAAAAESEADDSKEVEQPSGHSKQQQQQAEPSESDEEIDVVNDLPVIGEKKRELAE